MTWHKFDEAENKAVLSDRNADPRFEVQPGDLLFSRANTVTYVGAVVHVGETRPRLLLSDKSLRLIPRHGISPRWLLYYLRTQPARRYLESVATGTSDSMRNISQANLRSLTVPLAPIPEQARIVAAIEEQFSRLDAGISALKRVSNNLKRMRSAVLQAAMTGHLAQHSDEDVDSILNAISMERRAAWQAATNKPYLEPAKPADFPLSIPKHWRIASLEAITDPVRVICYGILMPKEHIEDGVPYVRVKDMKGWTIDTGGLNRTSHEIAAKYARASLRTGDLLLAIRGSYGRVAIVPPELNGGNITQDSARIAAHPAIDRRYLLYYLGGNIANHYYGRVARGVAVKGVNIGDLRSMPVPIPPRQEQAAIADEVERQFTLLNSQEAAVQLQARHSQSLRSSILAAAFSGKLVTQDRNDEPVSAFLDQIAAERASLTNHKPKRGRKVRIPREEATA
jgi:type I restriction enzyme S subunit